MCLVSGRIKESHQALVHPLMIEDKPVNRVASFKYLGTVIDENLSFTENVDQIFKKAQQRLHLLRKLRSFDVSEHVLQLVYRSLVESVLSFNSVSWFGHLTVKNKTKLARVVNQASKIVGTKQPQLCDIHQKALSRKATQILHDKTHPLNHCFRYLRSGRRLEVPFARKNIYKKSFIPSAVSVLNASH